MAKPKMGGTANSSGPSFLKEGTPPGASRSTGGPWPNAPLANTNFRAGGGSQNVAAVMKTGKKGIKGTSKVAPE